VPPKVLIVGGGISGLSTAWYLSKAGVRATIVESRPRLGGVIQTERVNGCVIEGGPDSWLAAKPAAMDLARELGIASEVIGSNDHLRKTFIRKNGRMVAMPDGLMMLAPTKVWPMVTTPLLGWSSKIHMGLEWFRSPKPLAADQSVAEFVREHYGQEVVDYLAEPLLSGIYGGDPEQMSVRAVLPRFAQMAEQYGSLSRGVLAGRRDRRAAEPIFRTLRGGLGQLVTALSGVAEVVHGRAEAVERGRVRVDGEWINADHIVLACEAHAAAQLAPGPVAELLTTVGYTSATVAALVFDAASFEKLPEGFGFLIPKKERRKLMACTWVGTKFAGRVAEGKVLARCFASSDATAEELSAELSEIAKIRAAPAAARVFRWPASMAQYRVGHADRMAELESRLAETPWLHVAGNAYHGIGIPDCIRMGKAAAQSCYQLQ
jgi:oxygen-dependent protoporphyrinogen oxidase